MENTVAKVFGLSQLRHFPQDKLNYMKAYPRTLDYPIVDKTSLVGIEVEVEGITSSIALPFMWKGTEDQSLKLNGAEFISLPINGKQIEYSLQSLFSTLNIYNPTYFFSPRCSIHVHTNVRNMTMKQIRAFVSTYLIFERALFNFVGEERDKNIHCVPLLDSSITATSLFYSLESSPQQWMKYTALNLLPLMDKGTLEFRHMHGTDNIKKLMTWIGCIISMKNFIYRSNVDELEMRLVHLNSNSQYHQILHEVFGTYANDLEYKGMEVGMEEGCTKVKQCFFGLEYLDSLGRMSSNSELHSRIFGKTEKKRPAFSLHSDMVANVLSSFPFDDMTTSHQIYATLMGSSISPTPSHEEGDF